MYCAANMSKFRILAFCFTGLVCAQALEIKLSASSEDRPKRKPSILFFMEKDQQNNVLEDFECKSTGRFANPRRCDSYIECFFHPVMNETLLYLCPPGQHYNTEIEECDDPCNAQCDQDLDCSCEWPHCGIACDEPEGLSPVATNCRLYVLCRNNLPTVLKCPENMGFDSVAKRCMDIEEANCVMPSNNILSIMRNW